MSDEPCATWTTIATVRGCDQCRDGDTIPDPVVSDAIVAASAWLWRATGRRFFGECSITVRPIPQPRPVRVSSNSRPYPTISRREGGLEVPLGFGPVRSITSVHVDGTLLAASAYSFDGRHLIRLDGDAWPGYQDWTLDPTADTNSGWQVAYTYGEDPPADGRQAAAVLACEIARACRGQSCRLPKRL